MNTLIQWDILKEMDKSELANCLPFKLNHQEMKHSTVHCASFHLHTGFQVTQTFHTTELEVFAVKYLSYKSHLYPIDLFPFF